MLIQPHILYNSILPCAIISVPIKFLCPVLQCCIS